MFLRHSSRFQQPARPHKKTSFAIINEVSANQSRASSPGGRTSPFRGKGFRPPSRSISPKPPNYLLPIDNVQTPGANALNSTVHFDISESNQMPHGIFGPRDLESYDILTDVRHKTLIQIQAKPNQQRPFSVLPAEFHSANLGPSVAPRHKFYHSTGDLYSETQPSSSASTNPRRFQKGLLRIVNTGNSNNSPSRIPRRKSLTSTSADNFRRRKSSISPPTRRVSITTDRPIGGAGRKSPANESIIDLGMMPVTSIRSLSRISRPTTLSPILGTPNREPSEHVRPHDNEQNAATSSPTKIPIRTGRSSSVVSRSNSRSQSRAPSNANSRDPSPRNSLLAQSNQQADSSVDSTEGNRKRLNIARKTIAADKKTTDAKAKSVSSSKALAKISIDTKALVTKKPPSFRRNTSSTTSSRKDTATATKTKKETTVPVLKREPSNVKKIPSVKRERSTVKKESNTANSAGLGLKREPSNLAKKTGVTLKRQSSKLVIAAAISRNKSDATKKLENKNSFKKEKTDVVSTAETTVTNLAANVTDAAAVDIERDPSLTSQDSNGTADKLVPLTKSNVVSMTTAAITAQPVQISTAVTNQTTVTKSSNSNQLTKTDSSGQIMTGETTGADVRDAILQTPATILEKSQKTLENIQKTVTEATDEIQKTIEENLTDLKSLENDMKMVETGQIPVPFEKKESTRTLKSIKSEKNGSDEKTDLDGTKPNLKTTTASPIEAKVSVIDAGSSSVSGSNGLKLTPEDSDERVSVRSIAMLPEVELESGNVDNGTSGVDGNAEPDGGDKIR